MAGSEDYPSEPLEFDPASARNTLLRSIRDALYESAEAGFARRVLRRGDADLGFVALLCAGAMRITGEGPPHDHMYGLAFVLPLGSGNASYRLYQSCQSVRIPRPTSTVLYELAIDEEGGAVIPTDPQETRRDLAVGRILKQTTFTVGWTDQFDQDFRLHNSGQTAALTTEAALSLVYPEALG